MTNEINERPADLIGLAEAARLLPCSRPGKKVHVATLVRWVQAGKLPGWKIGGRLFVSKADVQGMGRPVAVRGKAAEQPRAAPSRQRWVEERLRAHGMK